MLNDIIGIPSKQLHLKEAELGVNGVKLVNNSP
jgi:hypothetical protein